MKFLFWLTCLFIVLPLAELSLLLKLAEATNWKVSLLTVIVTGVVGSTLSRRQGVAILRRMQDDLAHHRMPTDTAMDAVLVFAAGLLLITPGLITDTVGLLLLVPPIRRWFKMWLANWFASRFQIQTFSATSFTASGPFQSADPSSGNDDPNVIDSHVVRRTNDDT